MAPAPSGCCSGLRGSWRRRPTAVAMSLLVGIAVVCGAGDREDHGGLDAPAISQLMGEIHMLDEQTAAERFEHLLRHGSRDQPPPHQDLIDHFVVLYMENHAAVRTGRRFARPPPLRALTFSRC